MTKNNEIIGSFCDKITNFGHNYSESNKIGTLEIMVPKSDRPDDTIKELFINEPICGKIIKRDFFCGKKTDSTSIYKLRFSISKEFFNGSFDTKTVTGKFLNFCSTNNIKSYNDFMLAVLPFVNDLNNYCHITKDKEEKRMLYKHKNRFISWCADKQLITNVERQYHHSDKMPQPDLLYKINFGEYIMYVREVNFPFTFSYLVIPMNDCLYKPKEKYEVRNMDFMEHLYLLQHIYDSKLFALAEIK